MGRELPQVINIIDLETTTYYDKPDNDKNEIIEIGICTLDISLSTPIVGNKRSLLIKPKKAKITEHCTKITTITQEMVDAQGIELEEAFIILKKEYQSKVRGWASWGDFDRNCFKKQCENFNLPYPFGPRHLNLKFLFSVMNGFKWELGMDSALNKLGIELIGTHHRGHDDAQNIAKIAATMFRRNSIWAGTGI